MTSGTTSAVDVSKRITSAENAFDECWQTLSAIKQGSLPEFNFRRILDFQPKLAQTLHALDRQYDAIRLEERGLIAKKSTLEPKTFNDRMSELAHFRDALKNTSAIGRGLGDAFAWAFYMGSTTMLLRQAGRPRVGNTPPGLGGIGELAFVKAFPRFKHYIPIYHGITTFLRSGDFSLIDTRSFKVAGLIELKTSRVDGKTLSLSMNVVGAQNIGDLADGFTMRVPEEPAKAEPASLPGFKEHLRSQVKTMSSVLRETEPSERAEVNTAYHTEELRKLSKILSAASTGYQQIGPGLVLAAADLPAASLSERFLDKEMPFNVATTFPELVARVRDVMLPKSNYNALIISEISLASIPGGTPLFWWPVDLAFLRKIFFHQVWLGSIFNPAHFAEKLVSRGFTIGGKGRPEQWSVHKIIDDKKAELRGLWYFLAAIQYHLMREEAAIDTIEKTIKVAGGRPNTRVDMNISHFMVEQDRRPKEDA